ERRCAAPAQRTSERTAEREAEGEREDRESHSEGYSCASAGGRTGRVRCQERLLESKVGGDGRIRTGDGGFADPCLTTWRRRLNADAFIVPRSYTLYKLPSNQLSVKAVHEWPNLILASLDSCSDRSRLQSTWDGHCPVRF